MNHTNDTGVLFDLDGVIVDTEGLYSTFWHHIGCEVYPTGVDDFESVIKGSTLPTILATYFPDPEVSADIVERLKVQEATMVYELFPGVRNFLEELNARGIPAAIVTSSGQRKMDHLFEVIDGLRDYFVTVLTDKDVTRSKPDPEGYVKAARAIGVEPENCFVFEDSISGVKAGVASGAVTIAVATTNPADRLRELTSAVIDSMDSMTVDRMLAFRK